MDDDAKKWFGLANLESEKGNTKKSIEYYSKSISIPPKEYNMPAISRPQL